MPIGPYYQPISELCIQQGANYQQWGKTAEMDKLFLLLYDQIANGNSIDTTTARANALAKYLGEKRSVADTSWFDNLPAEQREKLRAYSYNSALVEFDQGQFGLCGRFHRVLMQVYNELNKLGGVYSKEAIFRIWCNQSVRGMIEGLELDTLPYVAEFTGYRVNTGNVQENTGEDIEVNDGDRLRLYTQGINFGTQIWQLDGSDITGEISDVLNLEPAVAADTGVYTNTYTNASGTVSSEEFNVVIT